MVENHSGSSNDPETMLSSLSRFVCVADAAQPVLCALPSLSPSSCKAWPQSNPSFCTCKRILQSCKCSY